jgi:hypothetical protein
VRACAKCWTSAMRFHIPNLLLHTGCHLRSLSRTCQHEQQWHRGKGPRDPGRVAERVQGRLGSKQKWRCEKHICYSSPGQGEPLPPCPVQSSPVQSSLKHHSLCCMFHSGNPEPTADSNLGSAPTGRRTCDQCPVVHLCKES